MAFPPQAIPFTCVILLRPNSPHSGKSFYLYYWPRGFVLLGILCSNHSATDSRLGSLASTPPLSNTPFYFLSWLYSWLSFDISWLVFIILLWQGQYGVELLLRFFWIRQTCQLVWFFETGASTKKEEEEESSSWAVTGRAKGNTIAQGYIGDKENEIRTI
jgi:hypothetical protein